MEGMELSVNNWATMKDQASTLVKSGLLPVAINTPEKAIAVAMAAKELGIPMMEGFRSINVIQGKPTISPQLMLALAYRTKELEEIKIDSTDERCRVTITRKGKSPHTEEFGVKEATGLGLIGRDNYKKQPAVMFKWRTLAANLRVTFPDVMLGLYTPEELNAEVKVSDDGGMEVISQDDMVNTGVRVPSGFKDMTPEEQQERIGIGNQARKTSTGMFIFAPKTGLDEFQASIVNKPAETSPFEPISKEERLELVRLVKEKGIKKEEFLKAMNVMNTGDIPKIDYAKATEWIMRQEQPAQVGE